MKKKQGVSLIVLVITIIIMIILAAAVVISLTNAGIIDKANIAVDKIDSKNEQEMLNIAVLMAKQSGSLTTEKLKKSIDEYLGYGELVGEGPWEYIGKKKTYVIEGNSHIEEVIVWEAGLYDVDDNMLVSWNELKSMGLDISVNYTQSNTEGTLYYILKNNLELKEKAVKLVVGNETKIGAYSFANCNTIKEIIIPDTVLNIGDAAFSWCSRLKELTIPISVNIGSSGFSAVTGLEKLTFTKGTTGMVGEHVVCSQPWSVGNSSAGQKIHTIEFKNGVTSIKGLGLATASLKKIIIPASVIEFDSFGSFKNCLAETAGQIGSGADIEYGWTTNIPARAFYECTNLTEVMLLETITKVGEQAFYKCEKLLSDYIIPEQYTEIGNAAFGGCQSVTSVGPVGSNANLKYPWKNEIKENAFSYCTSLNNIIFDESITDIGKNAFHGCDALNTLIIPETVLNIGDGAFGWCSRLKELTIPISVNIGSSVFSAVTGLEKLTFTKGTTGMVGEHAVCSQPWSVGNGGAGQKIHTIEFKNGITSIKGLSLATASLKKIIIPASVIEFDSLGSFKNCLAETAGQIGSGADIEYGWTTSIPARAFYECTNLTEITMPETITTVGEYAFYNCSKLTNIIIDSEDITKNITTSTACGYLANYAINIYLKEGINNIGEYITKNYALVDTDKIGYNKYSK